MCCVTCEGLLCVVALCVNCVTCEGLHVLGSQDLRQYFCKVIIARTFCA